MTHPAPHPSRRESLGLAWGAALAFGPAGAIPGGAAAADSGSPDRWPGFSFLIVSDTHLGYRESSGAERQWRETAAELAGQPGDFVLHLGDVVDQGQVAQYAVYRAIRDGVGKPFHEIPGNHDPVEAFEAELGLRADRSFDHGGVRFILFGNARRDSHAGFLAPAQLAWLERECAGAAAADRWIVLCGHVPFHANRHPDRGWHVQPADGQTAFYELMARHRGRALALLHGHFHNGLRGWEDRAPLRELTCPSALYNQDRRLAEQGAAGYNLPEFRPGYLLATFADRRLELGYRVTGVPSGPDAPPARRELAYPA